MIDDNFIIFMKNNKYIILFGVSTSIALLLLLALLKSFLYQSNIFRKKPIIANNITSNLSKANSKFDEAVKEAFPVGLPEIELIRELNSQGFSPGWSYKNQHQAIYNTSNIACNFSWIVIWKTNNNGLITEINAQYKSYCL